MNLVNVNYINNTIPKLDGDKKTKQKTNKTKTKRQEIRTEDYPM